MCMQDCSKTDLNKGPNDGLESRQGRGVGPGKSRQGDDQQVEECDQLLPLQTLAMASWPRGGEWGQGEGFRSPLAVLEDLAHQLRREAGGQESGNVGEEGKFQKSPQGGEF